MPRISDEILECVFYLYPSAEDAERGAEAGGAGCFVSVPSEQHVNVNHLYAVSNWHVIEDGGSPVIRLNTAAGRKVAYPLAVNHWIPHPQGDDLAVAPLGGLNRNIVRYRSIPRHLLLTKEIAEGFDIGPGDDVFMVGRFIHHEGKDRNIPSIRSGIISVMPVEGIEFYEGGFKQEAFLIEMRSLSGYSGSPVFFILPSTVNLGEPIRQMKPAFAAVSRGPYLLGIDCGNFKYYDKVYEVEWRGGRKHYSETNMEAKSHAGQAIVIPTWRLIELLDSEEFVMARKRADEQITEARQRSVVELDAKRPEESAGLTQETFEEALRRASRKTPSPEEEKGET